LSYPAGHSVVKQEDEMDSEERWLLVPGFDAYEVSDHGRVRRIATGLILRTVRSGANDPRRAVGLYRDRKQIKLHVSRLVLSAFVRPPLSGEYARHLNDDLSNETLENLAWGFHEENREDARRNRLYVNRSPYWAGKTLSAETKAKISASTIGRKHTTEAKAKMAVATKKRMADPEMRARVLGPHVGAKRSEEARANMRAAWERRRAAANPTAIDDLQVDYTANQERWVSIPEWPEYEISNRGRVRRCDSGHLLTIYASTGRDDRRRVRLYRNRVPLSLAVARLLLTAFVRPPNPGEYARHLDDNQENDDLKNLVWGFHEDNTEDAKRNAQSAPPARKRRSDARRKGGKRSPEIGAKISAAKMGHTVSDETRERLSAAHRGRKLSPEQREKIGNAGKGKKKPSPKYKEAAARRGPEHYEKIVATRSARGYLTPAQREALIQRNRARRKKPAAAD
jgi:NUMOD4 motif/NUMOD3 motif